MFQFSKIMEPLSRRTAKSAKEYFANWIAWFKSRGILTEIRHNSKGAALWREGSEATEENNRKKRNK